MHSQNRNDLNGTDAADLIAHAQALTMIAENTAASAAILDSGQRIVFANAALRQHLGPDCLETRISSWTAPADRDDGAGGATPVEGNPFADQTRAARIRARLGQPKPQPHDEQHDETHRQSRQPCENRPADNIDREHQPHAEAIAHPPRRNLGQGIGPEKRAEHPADLCVR